MSPSHVMMTPHQARYFALDLRCRRHPDDVASMGAALFDARVDLHPHQVEAALFAMRAKPDDGRILADEVGLGKTIEAALVLSQAWAERRRRLLIICPAALRNQWSTELNDKFGLPTIILDGRNELDLSFVGRRVALMSYQFAARHGQTLMLTPWDLVVIDEAHRLRNIGRSKRGMIHTVVSAFEGAPKLLLTATPLQNSLLELHGLVSIVNRQILGDEAVFKQRYGRRGADLEELRRRIEVVVHRSLRRDVLPYIRFTSRQSMTWQFRSSDREQALYRSVTEFISRDELVSITPRVRGLMSMLLRKLLASSPAAIAGALRSMAKRIREAERKRAIDDAALAEFDDEGLDADWLDDRQASEAPPPDEDLHPGLEAELFELEALQAAAESIGYEQRAFALLDALNAGFEKMRGFGAAEKAVIFTESRRTQDRLRRFLEDNGYRGRVICFNGSNNDPDSARILEAWSKRNPERAAAVGRGVSVRAALLDAFRENGTLLLATEAGSEGLNLQFCSLVVNYDLPWNPQRVEQRIGRCHRYGQRHDVVVVNFIDLNNDAERRVLDLLSTKIGIFEGVLGASDTVLGAIEEGLDLEKTLHGIFRQCRSPAEIEAAFAALRKEMDEVIRARERRAHAALFEHFDDTVHDRLRLQLDLARNHLDRMGRQFWSLTTWALGDHATFNHDAKEFTLPSPLAGVDATPGRYAILPRGTEREGATPHRLSSALGDYILDLGARVETPRALLVFDPAAHPVKVSVVERLAGRHGWLRLDRVLIDGLNHEEHLVLSGFVDSGEDLDAETLDRLLSVAASVAPQAISLSPTSGLRLEEVSEHATRRCVRDASERNLRDYHDLRDRLERWADDEMKAPEVELQDIRAQIRSLEKRSRVATTLEEQRQIQEEITSFETRQRAARVRVFEVEDRVRDKRKELLAELERRMTQQSRIEPIFDLAWRVA